MTKYLLIAIVLLACNSQNNNTPPSQGDTAQVQQSDSSQIAAADTTPIHNIIVKTGFHEKIDLDKETFTVYFMNLTSKDYKFTLTDAEKTEIQKMAREADLAKLKDSVHVDDKCDIMPKVMTEFTYAAGDKKVKVMIDEFCDEHHIFKRNLPDNIQTFLTFVHKMVRAKPEVQKSAKTDIHYM